MRGLFGGGYVCQWCGCSISTRYENLCDECSKALISKEDKLQKEKDKMTASITKKPPLGLMPRNIWQDKVKVDRLIDIDNAIIRYINANKEIPTEWLEERNQLVLEVGEQVKYE